MEQVGGPFRKLDSWMICSLWKRISKLDLYRADSKVLNTNTHGIISHLNAIDKRVSISTNSRCLTWTYTKWRPVKVDQNLNFDSRPFQSGLEYMDIYLFYPCFWFKLKKWYDKSMYTPFWIQLKTVLYIGATLEWPVCLQYKRKGETP